MRLALLLLTTVLLASMPCYANNVNPGGRSHGTSWTDYESNVWIFGGWGYALDNPEEGALNDLWMFVPLNNTWNWMGGSQSINALGVYSGPKAYPGARESAVVWTTPDRRTAYIYGGYGYASAGGLGFLDDIWKFDIPTRSWTWIKGSSIINTPVLYSTTPSASATPGARYRSAAWTASATEFWLFGGSDQGLRNDVWMFNTTTNYWVYIGGPQSPNSVGAYGGPGQESPSYIPGSRVLSSYWTDSTGNFWLFGGAGYAATQTAGTLNDVWRFNRTTRGWAFIAGSTGPGNPGNFGVRGLSSGGLIPARSSAMAWVDPSNDDVIIFGGTYGAGAPATYIFNDMWRFRPSTQEFIWVAGASSFDQLGEFGEIGVPSKFNIPSSRLSSYAVQSGENAWLFGGVYFYQRTSSLGRLNDLWHIHLPSGIWTWIDGTNLANQHAVYEVPDFTILTLPEYLSGNVHISDRYTTEEWRGSFMKKSVGSAWNVSAVLTNDVKRASLIYSDGALIAREDGGTEKESCFDASEVLSDNVVGAAVQKAVLISDNDVTDPVVKACVGTKWEVNVLQELFVVCREDGSGNWKIFGINFVATLTDLLTNPLTSRKRHVELDDSSLFSGLFNCNRTTNEEPPNVTPEKWYQRDLTKPASDDPFDCVFLHGVGGIDNLAAQTEATEYWKKVGDFTPQCNKRTFGIRDTKRRGWTDTSLQQEYCELITGTKTGGVATNKLIFAHSMGNLILAAALKNNYCSLGKGAYWYNVQGPNKGSEVAKVLADACSPTGLDLPTFDEAARLVLAYGGVQYIPGTSQTLLKIALDLLGYCNSNANVLQTAYYDLIPASLGGPAQFGDLLDIMHDKVNGGMCGRSSFGLFSAEAFGTALTHALTASIHEIGSSDGLVPLASCMASVSDNDLGKFTSSYTSKFYLARVNHSDGRCVRNDGWWGVDRKPCLWYAHQGLAETKYTPTPALSSASSLKPLWFF